MFIESNTKKEWHPTGVFERRFLLLYSYDIENWDFICVTILIENIEINYH